MQSLQRVGIDVRVALLLRSAGSCWYCGIPLTIRTVTADHLIIPVRHGGQLAFNNLVASCRSCNRAKGSQSLAAFRLQRGGEVFWGERLSAKEERP